MSEHRRNRTSLSKHRLLFFCRYRSTIKSIWCCYSKAISGLCIGKEIPAANKQGQGFEVDNDAWIYDWQQWYQLRGISDHRRNAFNSILTLWRKHKSVNDIYRESTHDAARPAMTVKKTGEIDTLFERNKKTNVFVECSSTISIDFRILSCIDEKLVWFDRILLFFSPYCPLMIR